MFKAQGAAVAAVVGIAVSCLVGVSPASAGTAERGKYSEPYHDVVKTCGTTMQFDGVTTGHFVGQLRGRNPVPFYLDHFVDRTTYTNLDTERSFSSVGRITHLDTEFTQLEGTLIRISGKDAGTFTVYDGNGAFYYRLAGLQRFTAVIDTLGTEDEEDDVFLDFSFAEHGNFFDNDFCEDVEALTT